MASTTAAPSWEQPYTQIINKLKKDEMEKSVRHACLHNTPANSRKENLGNNRELSSISQIFLITHRERERIRIKALEIDNALYRNNENFGALGK